MHTPFSSHDEKGFSLIELLIVVAIIGILAAIAVPNYLSSRQAASSASAASALRVLHSSENSFRSSRGAFGTLNELSEGGYINDPQLRLGQKARYSFIVTLATTDNFEASATPADSPTVWRHFFIDASGVVRYSDPPSPASSASNPLS